MADEGLQKLVNRYRNTDHSHDIPYLGGISNDGATVYLDKNLADVVSWEEDGRKQAIEPAEFTALHEKWEKAIVDLYKWRYDEAHKYATAIERRAVMQAGKNWVGYSKALKPFIASAEKEGFSTIIKVPGDLSLYPYKDAEPKLYKHLLSIMGKGNKKGTKEEANYRVDGGGPSRHCGKVWQWTQGSCKHFEQPNACGKVQGFIEARGLCDWWTSADRKR